MNNSKPPVLQISTKINDKHLNSSLSVLYCYTLMNNLKGLSAKGQ